MSYEQYHALRVCRERCAESGYFGEAFQACVEECVKDIVKGGRK